MLPSPRNGATVEGGRSQRPTLRRGGASRAWLLFVDAPLRPKYAHASQKQNLSGGHRALSPHRLVHTSLHRRAGGAALGRREAAPDQGAGAAEVPSAAT